MKNEISTADNNDVSWQEEPHFGCDLEAIFNENSPDQDVPAHLTNEKYRRIEKTGIQSIEVKLIRHCQDIPDYLTPSSSDVPIVVANQGCWDCIEGWNLVEDAMGKTEVIECEVVEVPENMQSDEEVVLQKCSSRCATRAGTASYAEMIRVSKCTLKYLSKTNGELQQFAHGGRRKGLKFGEDRENDVLSLMANRMNLSRAIVQRYVDHGMYLNEDTLELFVSSTEPKLTRDFFRDLQPKKTALVKQLKNENKQDTEITREVSALAIAEYDELKSKINSISEDSAEEQNTIPEEKHTGEVAEIEAEAEEDDEQSEVKTHVHHTPEDDSESPQLTFDSVKGEMIELADKGSELAEELRQIDAAEDLENKAREHMDVWRELITKLRATPATDQKSN